MTGCGNDDDAVDVRSHGQLGGYDGDGQRQAVRLLDGGADAGAVEAGRADQERRVAALAQTDLGVDGRGDRHGDPLRRPGTNRQRSGGDRQVRRRDDRVVHGAGRTRDELHFEIEHGRAALGHCDIGVDDLGAHFGAQGAQRHPGHLHAIGEDRHGTSGDATGNGRHHVDLDVDVEHIAGGGLDRSRAVALGDVLQHALVRRRPAVPGRQLARIRCRDDPLAHDDAIEEEHWDGLGESDGVVGRGRDGRQPNELGLGLRRADGAEVERRW